MHFPEVSGSNLLRQKVTLPQDFEGELNLVLIAFQQWQQTVVDTWIPSVRDLERESPGFKYYELPTIQRLNVLARTFINEGMRAGIPDPVARERTVTLYVDKVPFRQALALGPEDDIYVLLLDGAGRVLWREEGTFTPEKGAALRQAIGRGQQDEAT
jgi:hypothetical protein